MGLMRDFSHAKFEMPTRHPRETAAKQRYRDLKTGERYDLRERCNSSLVGRGGWGTE